MIFKECMLDNNMIQPPDITPGSYFHRLINVRVYYGGGNRTRDFLMVVKGYTRRSNITHSLYSICFINSFLHTGLETLS